MIKLYFNSFLFFVWLKYFQFSIFWESAVWPQSLNPGWLSTPSGCRSQNSSPSSPSLAIAERFQRGFGVSSLAISMEVIRSENVLSSLPPFVSFCTGGPSLASHLVGTPWFPPLPQGPVLLSYHQVLIYLFLCLINPFFATNLYPNK